MTPEAPPDLVDRVIAAAGTHVDRIDWHTVEYLELKRPGIPYRITKPIQPDRSPGP